MIKLIVMVKKKEGMTQEEFDSYWREVHGPLVRNNVPGLLKYTQNHRIDLNGEKSPYDGIAELSFKDMDAYNYQNEWYMSEGGEILRNDIPNFMDPEMVTFICREELIF